MKNKKSFIQTLKKHSVPLLALLVVVNVILAFMLFSKLSSEKKLKEEKQNEISALSSKLDGYLATAVFHE